MDSLYCLPSDKYKHTRSNCTENIFTSLQITFQPTIHRFKETNNDSLLITVAVNQYFKDYNESSIGSLISMHVACTVWICLLFFPGHTK